MSSGISKKKEMNKGEAVALKTFLLNPKNLKARPISSAMRLSAHQYRFIGDLVNRIICSQNSLKDQMEPCIADATMS
jgi:hypothetical protein